MSSSILAPAVTPSCPPQTCANNRGAGHISSHSRRSRLLGRSCSPKRRRRWRRRLPTLTPTLAPTPQIPPSARSPLGPNLISRVHLYPFTNSHPMLLPELEMNSEDGRSSWQGIDLAWYLEEVDSQSRPLIDSTITNLQVELELTRQAPSRCRSSSRCSRTLEPYSPSSPQL